MPTPAPADSLEALTALEQAAIVARRQLLLGTPGADEAKPPSDHGLPKVGLALSGGGVRSATFALGLMRGLSHNRTADPTAPPSLSRDGLLGRLDYLSTVSGGGYTGAMWGRLVATYGMRAAQQLMADSGSPVLNWLRRNGRYLNPAGSRDTGIAIATYLRAWMAIHMEFMFACVLGGLVIVLPHLLHHRWQWWGAWEPWGTPWWVLALLVALLGVPGLIAGYWAAREPPLHGGTMHPGPRLREVLFLLVAGGVAVGVGSVAWSVGLETSVREGPSWLSACAVGLSSLAVGQAVVMFWQWGSRQSQSLLVARIRHVLTTALRLYLKVVLGLVALGAIDWLSWNFLLTVVLQPDKSWLLGSVGAGGVGLLVLRNLVQPLQQMAAETNKQGRDWLPRAVNLVSLLGCALLVFGWVVLVQWFVFAQNTFDPFVDVPPTLRALLLLILVLLWVGLTAGNAQMANASSLHSFYRARLTRAYMAVGNPARQLNQHGVPRPDVTTVVEGDDLGLQHYSPEQQGGPIHLVNACLNQTVDDRSGLYNADRKGAAMTATCRGFEVGPRAFIPLRDEQDVGTLGRWVAVSGAAASPGAGSYTSTGLALLLYLLGVRLGHWMQAPCPSPKLRWGSHMGWHWCPKPVMLASEVFAEFYGEDRPWWYLSDGGHFENTGVYALLKRELDFIILSDASCDVDYEFGDLENLVRKARIDFGAEIEFYSHAEAVRMLVQENREVTVLSPEDMANNHSCRGVLLARIRYRERPGLDGTLVRPEGTLLVVKPNLHDALDVDVLAYAQKHSTFPHESTSDQSFDEAQWESYHRLGEDFGRALTDTWLTLLPGWSRPAHHSLAVAARLGGAKPAEAAKTEPLWRRGARATAIGTTLGVGASGTLVLSLWQVQDQLVRQTRDDQTETSRLLEKVSDSVGKLQQTRACPNPSVHALAQIQDLLDRRGSPNLRKQDAAAVGRLAVLMEEECAVPASSITPSDLCQASYKRMQTDLCTGILKKVQNTAMDYWQPSEKPEGQARSGDKVLQALRSSWSMDSLQALLGPRPQVTAGVDPFNMYPPPVAAGTPSTGTPVPPLATAPAPVTQDPAVVAACARANRKTTLYIQVYDEASQSVAAKLRALLQGVAGPAVQVAPVENVVRSADVRQQRRPIPWAKPTFVLHDAADPEQQAHYQDCAKALVPWVRSAWGSQLGVEAKDAVWLRDLPRRLTPTPGVIELWLPPIAVQSTAIATAMEH
nr:hypothetical protein [uncultured Albidiferax sp.]